MFKYVWIFMLALVVIVTVIEGIKYDFKEFCNCVITLFFAALLFMSPLIFIVSLFMFLESLNG